MNSLNYFAARSLSNHYLQPKKGSYDRNTMIEMRVEWTMVEPLLSLSRKLIEKFNRRYSGPEKAIESSQLELPLS